MAFTRIGITTRVQTSEEWDTSNDFVDGLKNY